MMSLLRLVTIPYLRQNPLRLCLTILGVAFGVAIFVAIRVTNLSTLQAFVDTVEAVSGRTQLQIIGEVGGLDQSLYPRVRAMPGLTAAVPVVTGCAPPSRQNWRAPGSSCGHPISANAPSVTTAIVFPSQR